MSKNAQTVAKIFMISMSSPSIFNFLEGNSDAQLLRHAVKPCAGDLTGAKQAKSRKVKRPKCLRRQSFAVPPSAWA